eukprot:CAMPEP_0114510488 /NCGR_PEP_ID=MMETSP0109-20121206/13823_1 /TAXON_ID=29199 /ORGANISM="Chlorarachnion reptans, Strain CCCM449" /LENGTH=618 /DNA_ID=CAMNT_0001689817 /DNA_START=98 /DNA_END=1955 /DNA_ORIENTATION=-
MGPDHILGLYRPPAHPHPAHPDDLPPDRRELPRVLLLSLHPGETRGQLDASVHDLARICSNPRDPLRVGVLLDPTQVPAGFQQVRVRFPPLFGCCMDLNAPLLIANHSSAITDFVVLLTYHLPAFVAMAPVRNYPVLGRLAQGIGCLFVDRKRKAGAKSVTQQITERVKQYKSGCLEPRLAIFPEGTVSSPHSITKFRTGAFVSGENIQPICIHYSVCCLDISTLNLAGGPSDAQIFMRMLCQFANFVSLEYLPVYEPSYAEKNNPGLYADNVQRVMAAALEYPTSDHTFEDMFFQGKAGFKYYDTYILHKISGIQLKTVTGLGLADTGRLVRAFKILDELEIDLGLPEASDIVASSPDQKSGDPTRTPPTESHVTGVGKGGLVNKSDRKPHEEESTAGMERKGEATGRIGPLAFQALALGLVNKQGKDVEKVYALLQQRHKFGAKGLDFVSAAIGIGILNCCRAPAMPKKVRVRLAFPWDANGNVDRKDAEEILKLEASSTSNETVLKQIDSETESKEMKEIKTESKRTGSVAKRNCIAELYGEKSTISIDILVEKMDDYPVLAKAADAWLHRELPNLFQDQADVANTADDLPDQGLLKRLRALMKVARLVKGKEGA